MLEAFVNGNRSFTQLGLGGITVASGDWLELCIFGRWVPGQVCDDAIGWYLLTLDRVGIRLRAGLHARLIDEPLLCPLHLHSSI